MNIIKQGSKGGDVKILQKYLGLTQDGVFGPVTDKAVKEWQIKNGLTADGVVGNKSWLKLIEKDLKSGLLTDADYVKAAIDLNVEVAVLKAVKEVESCGKALINGVPVMLFEGHIFWQRLVARKIDPNKYVKGNEDILYRSWTKKYYTGKNSGEKERRTRWKQWKSTGKRFSRQSNIPISMDRNSGMQGNCRLCWSMRSGADFQKLLSERKRRVKIAGMKSKSILSTLANWYR